MSDDELLELANGFERQAMVLLEHMHGAFPRDMVAEAADLFTIASALRARLERTTDAE